MKEMETDVRAANRAAVEEHKKVKIRANDKLVALEKEASTRRAGIETEMLQKLHIAQNKAESAMTTAAVEATKEMAENRKEMLRQMEALKREEIQAKVKMMTQAARLQQTVEDEATGQQEFAGATSLGVHGKAPNGKDNHTAIDAEDAGKSLQKNKKEGSSAKDVAKSPKTPVSIKVQIKGVGKVSSNKLHKGKAEVHEQGKKGGAKFEKLLEEKEIKLEKLEEEIKDSGTKNKNGGDRNEGGMDEAEAEEEEGTKHKHEESPTEEKDDGDKDEGGEDEGEDDSDDDEGEAEEPKGVQAKGGASTAKVKGKVAHDQGD
eukprot:gnl/TRDRNA2_/TRDRNA2_153037_c0_seq3.p1 gnl/TRDRNA2_/TRDRNA2_153037_c0~~gnl/TRDRNA2_/TRDRNA2_153037_c0_seq3.p1  ORF type:complete len:318 (+),score=105.67 gnl/TRDRNA2_/TRDRNA2_153037_c0_seq3:867-1820(+)